MFSQTQCMLARTMTKDQAPDEQINSEYLTLTQADKQAAILQIESLCKEHDAPFDRAFPVIVNDFRAVANRYHISPATLFCAYMQSKQ